MHRIKTLDKRAFALTRIQFRHRGNEFALTLFIYILKLYNDEIGLFATICGGCMILQCVLYYYLKGRKGRRKDSVTCSCS